MSEHPAASEARSRLDDPNRPLRPEADPSPIKKERMIVRAGQFLVDHFAAYRRMGKGPFLWRISLEGLIVPLIPLAVVVLFFSLPHRTDLDGPNSWRLVVGVVILAPFFETLLTQALPIMLVRRCGGGFWTQVWISTVLFAACHYSSGISTVVFAGLMSGFYITFTYAHWRQESFRSALWMTAGTHAIHNLVLITLKILADK